MKKIWGIIGSVVLLGCGGDLDCIHGRECVGNVSRTCVNGSWVEVECKDNAPICDATLGCIMASQSCGNGIVEGKEECDGSANGRTCSDVNEGLAGEVKCSQDCRYDFSGCVSVACQTGEKRCLGDVYQLCADNAWTDAMDCAQVGLVCDAEQKTCIKKD